MTAKEAWRKWRVPAPSGNRYFDDLFDWQDGLCAMCGRGRKGTDGRLVKDHCHMTGLVRGYLCRSCNSQEGWSSDSRWDAWRAHDTPARAIGFVEIHQTIFGHTDISSTSVLHYYTLPERRRWWAALESDLKAGGDWPTDAPWTLEAETRRAELDAATRQALVGMFIRTDGGAA